MNNLFYWLNWKGKPPQVARQVVEVFKRGKLQRRWTPLLCVQHNGRVYFGFMFVLGPIVQLLKKYTDQGRTRWRAFSTAFQTCLASLIGWPKGYCSLIYPAKVSLLIDGVKSNEFKEVYVLTASTVERTAFGFRPFLSDGSYDLRRFYTIITSLSFSRMVSQMPLYTYGLVTPNGNQFLNCPSRKVVLTTTSEDWFTVDGEIYPIDKNRSIQITIGPEVALAVPS